ncbi:MAG: LysM peptidoglycan-binding domain-containing protein [Lentisphaeria bacterium]|nr:LysM peptidoglycan-binding domain-containing protein [Lentisphaeria bacterium]
MKFTRFAILTAVMLAIPAMFSACTSTEKEEEKTEPPVPTQDAEPVEVKPQGGKTETAPQAQPAAQETEPAPVLVPEQPAKEPAPAAKEPAPAAKEPAPAAKEPAPAAKEAKAAKKPPCDHVVKTGDNLWKLAREYYGQGAKWKLIYDANKAEIKDENFLEPGKVLKIPAAK